MKSFINQDPQIAEQIQQFAKALLTLANSDDYKKFVALLRSPAVWKMAQDYRDLVTAIARAGEASRDLWEPAFEVLSQLTQEDATA